MERNGALAVLSGLAHETRLDIFRVLVEAGPEGMPAGQIGERLGLPPATLSFHLNHLKHAGLIARRRNGRSLIYSADFVRMSELVGYLTENCCQGHPEACDLPAGGPVRAARRSKGVPSHEAPARERRR
jgi:ArsR family transcriptional regulator, arsenate/arsenite/antimonite-responsive transcriptional repressor